MRVNIQSWAKNESVLFRKMSNFLPMSWREQVTFNESDDVALHYSNMRYWIFIVLAHWNNSLLVDMLLHSDTLCWFPVFVRSPNYCVRSGESTNTNFMVFYQTETRTHDLPDSRQTRNPLTTSYVRGKNENNENRMIVFIASACHRYSKWYVNHKSAHTII
jgi:hypothetical protein